MMGELLVECERVAHEPRDALPQGVVEAFEVIGFPRQREWRILGFKSPGQAQCFLADYGPIAQGFRPRPHRLSAPEYRQQIKSRGQTWQEITGLPAAA
jgi:hypothetical protein